VHLLVNELCEYQNARCNDKKNYIFIILSAVAEIMIPLTSCVHWDCCTERKGWLHRYVLLFMAQKSEFENMWAQTSWYI